MPDLNLPQQPISSRNTVLKDCQVNSSYTGSIWQPPKFSV